MKQAKKRPLPSLAKLVSSINRTVRSLSETLAFCGASNKRIARKEMKALQSVTALKGLVRSPALPVSIEDMNAATAAAAKGADAVAAVKAMRGFMLNAPPRGNVNIKALIREGRDGEQFSDSVLAKSATGTKRKYSVKELMAECDLDAPMPEDMKEWEQMVPIGLECDIEITEEDGGFVARCPNPEVASDGKTPEEAFTNLREALALYFDNGDRG